MNYLKVEKNGDVLYSPIFEDKESAGVILSSSLPLPSTTYFYVYKNLIDRIGGIKPQSYDTCTIIDGYMHDKNLHCKLKGNKIYMPKNDGGTGELKYSIPIDLTNSVISIQANSVDMNNTVKTTFDYILDINHVIYILKDRNHSDYTLRTRSDPSSPMMSFSLGVLSGESNISIIFNGNRMVAYVNGVKKVDTETANYPKEASVKNVGVGCYYGEAISNNKEDGYIVSMLISKFVSSHWQNSDSGINEDFVKMISNNKGYFYNNKKSYENNVFQNELITRNELGEVSLGRDWFFTSD